MNPYKGAFSVPGDALVFTEKGNAEDKPHRILQLSFPLSVSLMYIYSTSLAFKKFKKPAK